MSQIDDFLSGNSANSSQSSIDDFLGEKPKKKKESGGSFSDYAGAVNSAIGQGIGSLSAGIGTFIQAPAANTLSGVLGAKALADRGLTWLINQAEPGSAVPHEQTQDDAQLASQFAAESRAENANTPWNLPAKAGRYLEKDSRRVVAENQANDRATNPELIRQQQAMGEAEGFVGNLQAAAENPLALTHTLVRSAPDMALGVGVGSVLARARMAGSAAAGEAAAANAAKAGGNEAVQAAAAKAAIDAVESKAVASASTAGTLSEAGSSAMQAREGVFQEVAGMPLDALAKSPRFLEIMTANGGDGLKARETLANELADQATMLSGAGTMAGSALTNKLFGGDATAKSIVGGRMTVKELGKRIGQDTVEEGLQGVPEDAAQYGATVQADPGKKYDPAGSLAQNMVAGFAMGSGGHGLAYTRDGLASMRNGGDSGTGAITSETGTPPATPPGQGAAPTTPQSGASPESAMVQSTEAEKALRTPVSLTALDRVNEIDGEISRIAERAQELTPENGYGPAFDQERAELTAKAQELAAERTGIAQTWPKAEAGAPTSFSTEAGARLDAQYAIMDAADLVTSHDESLRPNSVYPQELQPRDRSRSASEMQVSSIVQKLDPARLGLSADAATGAPIVGADGLVESGNARTIALKRVYQANGQKAEDYKGWLRENAGQFGLNPEAVDGMAKPVLVRVRTTPVNRAEFARQANASTVQRMSPSEQALSDSKRLANLEGLNPDDAGDFTTSYDFIRQFMGMLPITEQSDMVESDGRLSTFGYRRIQNAVLAKAYGDSPTLRRMTESMDDNLRNVTKALVRVAPTIAGSRERMQAGTMYEADIAPDLLNAVEGLSALKEKGWSVADELGQGDLTGAKYSPEAAQLLALLSDNIRSPRRIAEFVQRYYEALEAAGDPSQASIFGDDGPAPARADLLKSAQGNDNGNTAQDTQRRDPGEGARTDAQGGRQPENAPGNRGGDQGDGAARAAAGGQERSGTGQEQGQAEPVTAKAEKAEPQQQAAEKEPEKKAVTRTADRDFWSYAKEQGHAPVDVKVGSDLHTRLKAEFEALKAGKARMKEITGKKINEDWTEFSSKSETMGVPRADMPQIKSEHRGALTQFLAARGVAHESDADVSAMELKPTQAEFSPGKVKQAQDFEGGDRSILVSADGFVLDGHHQWLAKLSQGLPVRVIRFNSPMADLLPLARDFPSAEVAQGAESTGGKQAEGQSTQEGEEATASRASGEQQVSAADEAKFPAIGTITNLSVGPGGTMKPSPIKPGKNLYRETNLSGVDDLLYNDRNADVVGFYVADNPDLALGQGDNKGVQVVFRADALSGKENKKPGTGDIAGREYKTDMVAPKAVQSITMKAVDVARLRGLSRRALADFDKEVMGDGYVRYHRKGLPRHELSAKNEQTLPRDDAARWHAMPMAEREALAQKIGRKGAFATGVAENQWEKLAPSIQDKLREAMEPGKQAPEASEFIPAPDGGLDYGEITPEMGKAMRRQVGKIRLRKGDETQGLLHIEAGHLEQLKKLGFDSVQEFVSSVAKSFTAIYKRDGAALDVVLDDGGRGRLMVQLEMAADGDYYDIKTASPIRSDQFKNKKPLWERTGTSAPAAESNPPYPRGQSGDDSLSQTPNKAQPAKIEDSGEVLEGARKLYAKSYAAKLDEGTGMNTASVPLSKSWPEPDYQRLIEEGADPWAVALAHAVRDEIPTKPVKAWKLKGWVEKVEGLRDMAQRAMDGSLTKDRFTEEAGKFRLDDWLNKVDLYEAVGHAESLKGMKFSENTYSFFGGQKFDPPKKLWTVNAPSASASATWSNGNWGNDLVVADTKAEAIEKFKAWVAEQAAKAEDGQDKPAGKRTEFNVYSYRNNPKVFIVGKRISATKSIDLMEFESAKAANAFIVANQDTLETMLGEAKAEQSERREENAPRVGDDHRQGGDVTTEQFREAFGFRGEQFGASMPQAERQANMNQAYDALMDLAGVIGVPPKALSLNGELGLAFGARGHGGKNPAMAHYEADTTGAVTPNRVVINLTRKNGAGSLAHEWFHAVDNYFARMRGEKAGFLTESYPAKREGVRPEMVDAFKQVMSAIQSSGVRERSKNMDKKRTKDYWSTGIEMAARSFESYVIAKLQDKSGANDYLANILPQSAWLREDSYPYPTMGELPAIRAAFDNFFQTIKTRETEQGIALLSRGPGLAAGRVDYEALKKMTFRIRSKNPGMPPVLVLQDPSQAPKGLREYIIRQDAWHDVEGAMHQGRLFLFASGLTDLTRAEHVLLEHEGAHFGLRALLGDSLKTAMALVYANNPEVRRAAFELQKRGKLSNIVAVEEVIVDIPTSQLIKLKGWRKVTVMVRDWLQAHGFTNLADKLTAWLDGSLTQQERADLFVAELVRGAREYVAGKRPRRRAGYMGDTRLSTTLAEDIERQEKWLQTEARARGYEDVEDMLTKDYPLFEKLAAKWREKNPAEGGVMLSRGKTVTERIDEAQTLMQSEPAKRTGMVERGKQAAGELVDSLRDKDSRLELLDTVTQKLQDRFVDLKWLQGQIAQSGGTLTEMNDAYRGEELYHGRAATAQDVFLRDELKPMLEQMQRAGIGLEQMEAYLHAQHAPEANAELAKRNLNEAQLEEKRAAMDAQVKDLELALQRAMAAGTATQPIERALVEARAERSQWRSAQAFVGTEAERTSLSGMSDDEAAAIMAAVPDAKRAAYEALAKKVGSIIASTREMQVKAGLITQELANEWANLYAHYVPLHRDEAHPASRLKMGQGFSVKGKESKSRTGSQAKVTNILAHVAAQREQAITRGEKNLVAKRLWLLAAQNPMSDVWTLEKPKSSHMDAQTGLVVSGVDPNYLNKPNVLVVKIAGKDHAIVFNERNERAMRLVGELKNLDAPTLDGVTRTAAKMTRWLASVNTQYNPVFGVINFARDVQAAGLQLSTTALDGKQREVMQGSFQAFGSIWRAERGKAPSNKADAELAALWKEMQAAGGMTGYRDAFANIEDRVKALDKMLAETERGKLAKAGAAGLDVLNDYNTAMEGAVRLSAYKQAKAMGLSVSDAASLAKNLTVNFNRKGTMGRSAAPWFAFFNAAVQGSTRMIQTLRGPMGKRIMAGGVLLGMVTSLLSIAMMGGGGDDEDKDKQTPWQKIPDFVKERSLILGWGEDYIAVPMPLGYNLFTNAGRVLAEQLAGQGRPGKGVGDALVDVLSMAVGAFNPVGGSDLASAVTPTPADWAVDLLRNKDWTGRDIAREDTNKNDPTPGHSRAKDSATPWAKAISRGANWVTGGTEYQPGVWSPTPDQIDYVIGQLTGGVGRELGKLATTVASPFNADELPANKIPLLSRVYGNTRSPQSGADLFYENVKKANELENEIVGRRKAGESLVGVPDYAFEVVGRGNAYETHVRKLRQLRKHLVQEGADGYKERVKEIEVKIGEAMDDFNRDVNRARRLDAEKSSE